MFILDIVQGFDVYCLKIDDVYERKYISSLSISNISE